jgi:hypothetical protein
MYVQLMTYVCGSSLCCTVSAITKFPCHRLFQSSKKIDTNLDALFNQTLYWLVDAAIFSPLIRFHSFFFLLLLHIPVLEISLMASMKFLFVERVFGQGMRDLDSCGHRFSTCARNKYMRTCGFSSYSRHMERAFDTNVF